MACANINERVTLNLDDSIEVTDDAGNLQFRVAFREAFEVRG